MVMQRKTGNEESDVQWQMTVMGHDGRQEQDE